MTVQLRVMYTLWA